MSRVKNMTQGSPAKLIFFFALPLFIGNLFQQIYNMADTLIVGRTIGVTALALCFLATMYPARQAARLSPVEALRHD